MPFSSLLSRSHAHTHDTCPTTHATPEHQIMRIVTFVSIPLFLWDAADGFAPSGSRLSPPAAASFGASRSRRSCSRSLSPLCVSTTQTEEELREKLARDNEDLSEVSAAVLPYVHTRCNISVHLLGRGAGGPAGEELVGSAKSTAVCCVVHTFVPPKKQQNNTAGSLAPITTESPKAVFLKRRQINDDEHEGIV